MTLLSRLIATFLMAFGLLLPTSGYTPEAKISSSHVNVPPEQVETNLGVDTEMSMNPGQLREAIRLVLKELDPLIPYSEDAVELLMLTAAKESNLGTYIKQIRGPALGVFQMEPATAKDHLEGFLAKRPELKERILGLMAKDMKTDLHLNLMFQIAMARLHYFRKPHGLPSASDVGSMAEYWKQHYNTYLGAGKASEAEASYRRLCPA